MEVSFESKIAAAPEAVPMQGTAVEEDNEVMSSERANEGSRFHCAPKKHLTSPPCHLKYIAAAVAAVVALAIVFVIFWLRTVPNENSTQVSNGVDAPALPGPVCPKEWIGYEGKCYFFSEEKGNWNFSRNFCSSYNASLALIQNEAEKVFILRYMGIIGHWIGLQKDPDQTWKWADGTEFNDLLELRGKGEDCAYLSTGYAIVSPCYVTRYWICSQPDAYGRAYVRGKEQYWGTATN